VYKLAGELSQKNARTALAEGNAAISQGQSDFDLSGLERIDSAAVAVMIEWQRQARKKATLQFHALPASLISLIRLYGLSEQFITPSSERH
jgi:phospholipid transport system transporter-binding protein